MKPYVAALKYRIGAMSLVQKFKHSELVTAEITYQRILRVLLVGFSAVIGLFAAAGFIASRNVRETQQGTFAMLRDAQLNSRLLDVLQCEQEVMAAPADNRKAAVDNLTKTDAAISSSNPDPLWKELKQAMSEFSDAARASSTAPELLLLHRRVTGVMDRIVSRGFSKGLAAQYGIENRSRESLRESMVLLAGSLFLGIFCAVLTLRIAAKLVRGMEQQSLELSQVTWHMLQDQETTARRFSHELHDELGQSLTAVKANLSSMRSSGEMDPARMEDCNHLIDEAIRNVRELSQLLHPTILDDFGLDASVRWLAERFTERTGVEVQYESNFNERLPDESETHVFRIVQEALTNVARHSGATRVRIQLERRDDRIHLCLIDNGKGLRNSAQPLSGMGLTGMRARARSAGGELTVTSRHGDGVSIELWAPLKNAKNGR